MASASASSLILFVVAVTVAAGVAGTMATSVSKVSDSIDEYSLELTQDIETDVEVISDPGSGAVYRSGNGTVVLLVKNTGQRRLPVRADTVEVLVDGRYVPPNARTVEALDGARWRPGDVLRLRVSRSLSDGPHRVSVVVGGDRERFRFVV